MRTPTHCSPTRQVSSILSVSLLILCGSAIGCGENVRDTSTTREDSGVNAGLNAIAKNGSAVSAGEQPDDGFDETRQRVKASAALLDEYFEDASQNTAELAEKDRITRDEARNSRQQSGFGTNDGSGVRVTLADASGDIPSIGPLPQTPQQARPAGADRGSQAPNPGYATNPEARKEQLVDELVGVLTDLAQSADDPSSSAIALTGLEAIRPDTLKALVDQGLLSDAEEASLNAVRDMLRTMVDSQRSGASIASPARVSDMLERIRRDLNSKAGIQIRNAQLCVRVMGFGQFEPFASNTFVAGRAHRAIVYLEMDRFAQREGTGDDGRPRFEVELSQRLELYHIADDLNTWNRAAETDKTSSRNRMRDYYLVNQIVIPANLGVGRYHLKVVMRDLISDQVVETIIPIEIVAG